MQSSSSRNKRTTDRGNVNLADVVRAIRAIKLGKETVRAAARSYNLPRTTLRRYLEKVSSEYEDISTVTNEELQETIKRLGTYAACAVKQVSKLRQTIVLRELDSILTQHPFPAADIWNMDETGFSTVPTKIGKVISLRGIRRVGQIAAQERGSMVTMALAVNAEGNSIPPVFLFPRQNMQSTFMENASPGAIGFANGSGWMQQTEFVKYMQFFIDRTKASQQSPKLLLIDNHASHLSVEALDLAVENGVTFLSFPPHCSHRLQPLDVSVYGPVKTYYKSQCNAWQKNHAGQLLEIRHIPGLVRSTLDLALTPRNIKAGFLATGIAPYNPDIFADSDFVQAVLSGENDRAVTEAEVNDEELQRRIAVSDVLEVDAHEEVAMSTEPSTSMSRASNLSSVLTSIGPLQAATPAKKSKRERRSMTSTVLTSPESLSALREKQQKRDASKTPKKRPAPIPTKSANKTPPKRSRPPKKAQKKLSSGKDEDFCLICSEAMPRRLNRNNSIACIECKREMHLKCANITTRYYICRNCDSE